MSNEVYAYLASKKWRARAGLVAAGELPPLPDNLGAEDEDETDGGGPAAFPIAELRAELAEDEGFAP